MAITKGKVIKYALLPGIIPRIFAFATSGFSYLAYYMALVYSMVRLLPMGHPYLDSRNIGKFGLRHVIAQASNNLVFSRKNIDQIIIFFTILLGLGLIFVQFILLAIAIFTYQDAFALGVPIKDLFTNPNALTNSQGPKQDLAFIILDKVFGLTGIYGSCISTGVICEDNRGIALSTKIIDYPYPFHFALHKMLQFYSSGMIVIGAIVLIYHTITIVGETATTGTPFGKRFNKAWVPIRIVLFFAMLIPLNIGVPNAGLNGAQILTFWIAKHGSNFATNGWTYFTTVLANDYIQERKMVAKPNIPEVGALNQFMLTAKTCAIVEGQHAPYAGRPDDKVFAYIVRSEPPSYLSPPSGPADHPNALEMMSTDHARALEFVMNGNIRIVYGTVGKDTNGDGIIDEFSEYPGNVFPTCGEMVLETTSLSEPGANAIQKGYYELLQAMWENTLNVQAAQCYANKFYNGPGHDPTCPLPSAYFAEVQNNFFSEKVQDIVKVGIDIQISEGKFQIPEELVEKGWAGAAIWFNRIAEMNGALTAATFNVPRPNKYPYVLEEALAQRIQQNADTSGELRYSLVLSNGRLIRIPGNRQEIHPSVHNAYLYWARDGLAESPDTAATGNAAIDTINTILGTSGIFEMRENADVHPMAQLTALGQGMMQATVRNAAYALAGVVAGGVLGIIDPFPAEVAKVASNFLFTMVTASVGIAVILYYVLPFLPFIYFMFALSGWIKSIFEAVVAMPLWALAHLRIDGDGLPGKDAASGYYLLLEIFLRPILILFGLIASISIFGALIYVLNNAFDLMVTNVGGSNRQLEMSIEEGFSSYNSLLAFMRGPVDEFFLTAMYAIICYIIGLSCFKLVDLIPNNILRWAGSTVATFQENAGDPAGQLTSQVYRGSILTTNQIRGATQGNLEAIVAG